MNLRFVVFAAIVLISAGSATFASQTTVISPQPRPTVWERSPFAGIAVAYVRTARADARFDQERCWLYRQISATSDGLLARP